MNNQENNTYNVAIAVTLSKVNSKTWEIISQVLWADYDIKDYSNVSSEIKDLQVKFNLWDCYVFDTKNWFTALFLWDYKTKLELKEIFSHSKYVDSKFIEYVTSDKYNSTTTRTSWKNDNDIIFKEIIKSEKKLKVFEIKEIERNFNFINNRILNPVIDTSKFSHTTDWEWNIVSANYNKEDIIKELSNSNIINSEEVELLKSSSKTEDINEFELKKEDEYESEYENENEDEDFEKEISLIENEENTITQKDDKELEKILNLPGTKETENKYRINILDIYKIPKDIKDCINYWYSKPIIQKLILQSWKGYELGWFSWKTLSSSVDILYKHPKTRLKAKDWWVVYYYEYIDKKWNKKVEDVYDNRYVFEEWTNDDKELNNIFRWFNQKFHFNNIPSNFFRSWASYDTELLFKDYKRLYEEKTWKTLEENNLPKAIQLQKKKFFKENIFTKNQYKYVNWYDIVFDFDSSDENWTESYDESLKLVKYFRKNKIPFTDTFSWSKWFHIKIPSYYINKAMPELVDFLRLNNSHLTILEKWIKNFAEKNWFKSDDNVYKHYTSFIRNEYSIHPKTWSLVTPLTDRQRNSLYWNKTTRLSLKEIQDKFKITPTADFNLLRKLRVDTKLLRVEIPEAIRNKYLELKIPRLVSQKEFINITTDNSGKSLLNPKDIDSVNLIFKILNNEIKRLKEEDLESFNSFVWIWEFCYSFDFTWKDWKTVTKEINIELIDAYSLSDDEWNLINADYRKEREYYNWQENLREFLMNEIWLRNIIN